MVHIFYCGSLKIPDKLLNLKWIYLGELKGYERTLRLLKEENRQFVGDLIEQTTDAIRNNFIDFIGKMSLLQEDPVSWYSASIASKSISQSNMFQRYLYIKLLENLSQSGGDSVFVCDDLSLIHMLKELSYPNLKIYQRDFFVVLTRNLCFIKDFKRKVKYSLLWLLSRLFNKVPAAKDIEVIIYSPIDDNVFKDDSKFSDSYFGKLEGFLSNNNCRVWRVIPIEIRPSDLIRLRSRFANIIYPLGFLKPLEFFRILFSKLNFNAHYTVFDGNFNQDILDKLIRKEIKEETDRGIFRRNLLYYYSFRNIGNMLDSKFTIIYPFENQPWEKMLNLSLNRANRVAYQHTIIPNNWLDYRVSSFENNVPLPNTIFASGKRWKYFLEEHYKNTFIEDVGAIRLNHIFKEAPPEGAKNYKFIIVALPIYPKIALTLQSLMLNILRDSNNPLKDYSIIIKPHSYLPRNVIKRKDFSEFRNCRIIQDSISESLKTAALLVTSSSTLIFESVSLGCKTLYLIPEDFSDGTEFFIKEHLFISYENNFLSILKQALACDNKPKINKDEYFSVPDYAKFLQFIKHPVGLNLDCR